MTRAYNTATTQQNSGGAVVPFVAGKNKIINGNFSIWQRGTSSTSTGYSTADRWSCGTDATATFSQQTFTPGAAPVAGYEGQYFMRLAKNSGGSYVDLRQFIEDVRTLAGQTVTLSFWAKCGSGTESLEPYYSQDFGSGGSGGVSNSVTAQTITTSWARYSFTFTLPSVSGKTIGANSFLLIYAVRSISSSTARTIDVWGVQLETGSVATPFTPAGGGSQQAELALCQRYFANIVPSTADYGTVIAMFQATSGSTAKGGIQFPVPMRASASITLAAASNFTLANASYTPIGGSSFTYAIANTVNCRIDMSVASGLTAGNATALSGNTANLLIQASAEL
jgi:hypothetical protein